MITEEIIKNSFIIEVLTADLDRVKSAQLSRLGSADANAITAALQSQTRNIAATATGVVIKELIDKRLRYLLN
jgi:hypothetical protein